MLHSFKFILCCSNNIKRGKVKAILNHSVGNKIFFYPEISVYKELREDPALSKLVLIDFDEKDVNGITLIREVKILYPKTKFVCFKTNWQKSTLLDLFNHKIDGVCTWTRGVEELRYVFKSVTNGHKQLTCDLVLPAMEVVYESSISRRPPSELFTNNLSTQEQKILNLLINGQTLHQISITLGIKYETTRSHLKNIYRKMKVNSMVQAVVKAIKSNPGLINI